MKKMLLFIGVIVCIIGGGQLLQFVFDYAELSEYGKGYIWGKVLIVFIGITMIIISKRI